MRSLRASHTARCSAIQRSACDKVLGTSSQVRTRPTLFERITPLRSSTDRCFMNDGNAIPKGAASTDTDSGPRPSTCTMERRVGSASAQNRSVSRVDWLSIWLRL